MPTDAEIDAFLGGGDTEAKVDAFLAAPQPDAGVESRVNAFLGTDATASAPAAAGALSPESPPRPEPPQLGGLFNTIDQYGADLLKQVGIGAVESGVASPLRGAATSSPETRQLEASIAAIQQGADIDVAARVAPTAPQDARTDPLYQAGEAVSAAVGSNTPSPLLHPVVTDIARGLGSVAGSIVSSPTIAAPILAGRGEALQTAVQGGATPEQQERAAQLGSAAGATDYADLLLVLGGSSGKALSLIKRLGVKVLEGAFIEGGQEGVQQLIQNAIQQGVYNPDQPLFQDVPYNAFIGAVVGGAIKGASPGDVRHPAQIGADAAQTATAYATLTGEALPRAVDLEAKVETAPVAAMADPTTPGKATVVAAEPQLEDPKPIFYSQLRRVAEAKLPESASPQQIMATLRNAPGVKAEEIEATGVEGFLASQQGRVSKSDLVAYLEDRAVRVSEVVKGPEPKFPIYNRGTNDTQYSSYMAPGESSGYRELLLTLPEKPGARRDEDVQGRSVIDDPGPNNFKSGHFDELNVVAHVRFTSRADRANRPVLHIEEIQSDWHQKGRRQGYRDQGLLDRLTQEFNAADIQHETAANQADILNRHIRSLQAARDSAQDPYVNRKLTEAINEALDDNRPFRAMEKLGEQMRLLRNNMAAERTKVPDAPFKTSWPELALKRMIRWAADNGYSQISWNSGDLAAKYAAGGVTDPKTVAGLREFYDRILPSLAGKLGKRFGGVVGQTTIDIGLLPGGVSPALYVDPVTGHPSSREGARRIPNPAYTTERRVHTLELPAAARTKVQEGLPLFQVPEPEATGSTIKANIDQNLRTQQPAMTAAIGKLAAALNEYAQRFKMASKIVMFVHDGPIPGWPTARGLMTPARTGNGFTYKIDINARTMGSNIADMWGTIVHEFGHAVMLEHFINSSDTVKLAIMDDYHDFASGMKTDPTVLGLLNRRSAASRTWVRYTAMQSGLGVDPTMRVAELSPDMFNYHTGFKEWFADMVAKWATTTAEPISVVDKYFSGLAKALKLFAEFVAKKLGIDPRAPLASQNWLDGIFKGGPPMTAQVYASMDLRTQKQNQYYIAPNVPAAPQTASTSGTRAAVGQAFNKTPPKGLKAAAAHADKTNWIYKFYAGILDLRDRHPFFTPLNHYTQNVTQMHIDESKIQDATGRILKDWGRLGEQSENLVAFLDDLNRQVYLTPQEKKQGVSRHPTQQEFDKLVRSHKLESPALSVFQKVKNFFDKFLVLTGENAIADAQRIISDPVALAKKVDEIRGQMAQLGSRPYFPLMRFGRHFVTVRDAAGNVQFFRTYERKGIKSAERVQQDAEAQFVAQYGRDRVQAGILPEETQHFLGLPTTLLQSMKEKMQLTPAQVDALEQLQFQSSPSLSFKHRFQHRDFVPGYSQDFARAFASYGFFGAKYYARTKWAWQLRNNIAEARAVGGNNAAKIADFMSDHLDKTILDARGDYGLFRGMIFHWHLGFAPAAALANMSQTPSVTYPLLASEFGELRAIRAMGRAIRQIDSFYKKGYFEKQSAFELRAIDYGIKTGRISESQASQLAGLTQSANLGYGRGTGGFKKAMLWFQEKSAWMFEMAEQWNRRIAYRAALDLAMQNPRANYVKQAVRNYSQEFNSLVQKDGFTRGEAAAIVTAVHATQQSQFVYSRFNRPRLFRGRVSGSVLVFQMFTQGVLMRFMNGSKGYRFRYLMMAMLFGGMGGVPGYEEVKGLVEAMLKWAGYKADAELQVRRWVRDHLGVDSSMPADLILHGMSRRGFGIPAIADMLGSLATGRPGRGLDMTHSLNVPFPVLDRSKAVGHISILPVDIEKILYPGSDAEKVLGQQGARASGAGFGTAFNIYKAAMDSKMAVDDPKRWERAVPRMLGTMSKGYRYLTEGRERAPGGRLAAPTIVDYDIRDSEHIAEIIAETLGFNTLRKQLKWDAIMAQNERSTFVEAQRKTLYGQMTEAVLGKQQSEIERVKDAIVKFNASVVGTPDRGMAITGASLHESVQGRIRDKYVKETPGVATQRGRVPIAQEILSLFPETAVEIRRR